MGLKVHIGSNQKYLRNIIKETKLMITTAKIYKQTEIQSATVQLNSNTKSDKELPYANKDGTGIKKAANYLPHEKQNCHN